MNTLHKNQINYISPSERFYDQAKAGVLIELPTAQYGRVETTIGLKDVPKSTIKT
jgi:hypothetical protein